MKTKYPIEVFWSDEDECYIAIAPDLPGCSAAGDSEEEALKEIRTAMSLWLDTAKKMKRKLPKPSPPVDTSYSGKFLMRVPKTLHANLSRSAKQQGVSLNQYVLYMLAEKSAKPAKVSTPKRATAKRASTTPHKPQIQMKAGKGAKL